MIAYITDQLKWLEGHSMMFRCHLETFCMRVDYSQILEAEFESAGAVALTCSRWTRFPTSFTPDDLSSMEAERMVIPAQIGLTVVPKLVSPNGVMTLMVYRGMLAYQSYFQSHQGVLIHTVVGT